MKRILAIVGLACLLASCSKVGQKFDQSNSGSPGAATSGNSGSSTGASTTTTGTTSSADATGGEAIERANPTELQKAALTGGQEAKWDQQGMSWTLPKDWKQGTVETKSLVWSTRSGRDLSSLIVNISPMAEDFPTDISLKAFYDGAVTRKKNGEVDEVRWLEIDGVKGVMFREAVPETEEGFRRLQWLTYRKYAGQSQMVNLMLATTGRNFEKNQDTFYAILYSTKLVH
jgi:hypothetical protein